MSKHYKSQEIANAIKAAPIFTQLIDQMKTGKVVVKDAGGTSVSMYQIGNYYDGFAWLSQFTILNTDGEPVGQPQQVFNSPYPMLVAVFNTLGALAEVDGMSDSLNAMLEEQRNVVEEFNNA